MGSQRLRPLPWGMTSRAQWVLPRGLLTDYPEAAKRAPWRPWLEISWRQGRTLVLVMMNPSAATEKLLDATVRNALYQALRLDINGEPVGRLVVVNAYDVRATTLDAAAGRAEVQLELDGERVILGEGLPLISRHCDTLIAEAAQEADLIVCGWGAKVSAERARELLDGPLSSSLLHAWRTSPEGFPKHPRGQSGDALPLPWKGEPSKLPGASWPILTLRPEAARLDAVARRRARDGGRDLRDMVPSTLSAQQRESLLAGLWRWA